MISPNSLLIPFERTILYQDEIRFPCVYPQDSAIVPNENEEDKAGK